MRIVFEIIEGIELIEQPYLSGQDSNFGARDLRFDPHYI